jgi:SAM-dependent methyltransferase
VIGRFTDTVRAFLSCADLVTPTGRSPPKVGLYTRDTLPVPVREMLESRSPQVEPYSQLAAAWHEHGTVFLPRYGRYIARLVTSGAVRPGLALDLASGTGITAAALAPLFERVYAVDRNEHMLREARSRVSHPNVEYVRADFRAFELPHTVDLAVCSGDSLNYVQSTSELREVFECVVRALRPGGLFLFDVQSEASFLASSRVIVRYADGEADWFQVHQYDRETRVDDSCAITEAGVEPHRRIFLSPDDVSEAALRAGLTPAVRFDTALLRFLAAPGGRDFYAFRRSS